MTIRDKVTLPGHVWVCEELVSPGGVVAHRAHAKLFPQFTPCGFRSADFGAAESHADEHAGSHWVYEHTNGDINSRPTRSMHGSDSGGAYLDDVIDWKSDEQLRAGMCGYEAAMSYPTDDEAPPSPQGSRSPENPLAAHLRKCESDRAVLIARVEEFAPMPKLDDVQFRALLDLLMCSDPWPVSDKMTELPIVCLATDEAKQRGYDDWIVAYHEFKTTETINEWAHRRGAAARATRAKESDNG